MSTDSSNSKREIRRIQFFLVLALLTVIGTLIRICSYINYAPISTQYSPNIEYAPWYIVQHGRLFFSSDIPTYSLYTSGVVYGTVDFLHSFLHSTLLIVLGYETIWEVGRFYRFFPWQATILFPIVSLLLYNLFIKTTGNRPNQIDQCLIYILSMVPTYNMIVWSMTGAYNLVYGWVILFILYYLLIAKKLGNSNKFLITALYVFFIMILQITYHTIALAYLFILLTITFTPILIRAKDKIISVPEFTVYIVIFITFLMYHAVSFWNDYLQGLKYFYLLLVMNEEDPLSGLYKPVDQWWLILQSINYILIATPVLIFLYQKFKRYHSYSMLENYHFYWIASLGPLALVFFIWNGIVGVIARINQYGSLISLITFSFLLVISKNSRLKHFLRIIMILTILIASFSYVYSNCAIGNSLTYQEYNGELWISEHISKDKVILTDFRMATPFTYFGLFKVVGISSVHTPKVKEQIENIFYGTDGKKAIASLLEIRTTTNEQPDYLFFSQQMTKKTPTIMLPSGYYKSAPQDFVDKYNKSTSLNKIYHNGDINLYSFIKT